MLNRMKQCVDCGVVFDKKHGSKSKIHGWRCDRCTMFCILQAVRTIGGTFKHKGEVYSLADIGWDMSGNRELFDEFYDNERKLT